MTETENSTEVIVALVHVDWKERAEFAPQTPNQIVYLISHFGERTNRQVRKELAKSLVMIKNDDVITSFRIHKIIRSNTNDESIHQHLTNANGFIHINMETQTASFYANEEVEDEEVLENIPDMNTASLN